MASESHILEFRDITFAVDVPAWKAKLTGTTAGVKSILRGVSGRIHSGQVMAIIGPSGAGKTTILDTLAQQPHIVNNPRITIGGDVLVDGKPLTRAFFSKHCAYVPQHDSLWPALTAKENIMYSARMHGDPEAGESSDQVLRELGLEGCRDTMVGSPFIKGLSGGQKRRVSLGCELVNKHSLFYFLDEPTSGLDAAAAAEIMQLITGIARKRNVVVATSIHQPSSHIFYSFDQLLLLSGGRTAYYGGAEGALAHFERLGRTMTRAMNPADFLLEIVNADFADADGVEKLLDAWEQPADATAGDFVYMPLEAEPMTYFSLRRVSQLVERAALCYRRDPAAYLFRFGMYGFMSLFISATYSDTTKDQSDIGNTFFAILWSVAFFSYMAMVALPSFSIEKANMVKEVTNGQYFLSGKATIVTARPRARPEGASSYQ